MLFLPVELTGSLLVLYGPGMLVGEPGVLFYRVECLETWEQSWKMPCINLHRMSLVVVVFLVEELILYAELLGVAGLRVETL